MFLAKALRRTVIGEWISGKSDVSAAFIYMSNDREKEGRERDSEGNIV